MSLVLFVPQGVKVLREVSREACVMLIPYQIEEKVTRDNLKSRIPRMVLER